MSDDLEAMLGEEGEGGATVVVAPKRRTKEQTNTQRQPPYNVIILNDEEHTFDYVIELLCKIFNHALTTSEALTWAIHLTGRAVVYTTHRELAELKCDQVRAYGPDPRLNGSSCSLQCYVEPAPSD
jgi:ATP-dependent Clp protease adaptor protein ClpS